MERCRQTPYVLCLGTAETCRQRTKAGLADDSPEVTDADRECEVSWSPDGVMDGDQFGSVGKGALDLDLWNHLRDAVHDRIGSQHGRAQTHDLRDRLPIANHLEDFGGDESHRLRVIQFQAARSALSRQLAGRKNQQLVDFTRCEMHESSVRASYSGTPIKGVPYTRMM